MEENTTKEINLLQLISLLGEWLKKQLGSLFRFFGYLLKLSYRQLILLAVLLAIAIGIGQFFARKSAREYQAEGMVMIHGGEAQTVREICKQLETSLGPNPATSLASKLTLPDSIAQNITGIRSFYVIDYMNDSVADVIDYMDNHSLNDTVNIRMKDRVYLRVTTRDIKQLAKVQSAILGYLNNNRLLQTQFKAKKAALQEQVEICNRESKRIDSLAKVSYFRENNPQLRLSNDKILLGEQSKQLFYYELLRLSRTKSEAEIKLAEYNQPAMMPSGLVANPFPLNGRLRYAIYSFLIGYPIALVLLILAENLKKILNYLKK
ncbi:MAG TPA: hypothetical protein VK152_04405 [Paludibacter sp.]|nr:hypothetical protein [Paludibacter sp.]